MQRNFWSQDYKNKLIDRQHVGIVAHELKKQGLSIATLNGSFDLLHAGHMQILYEGSQTADIFIVALNSDDSIKQYKSPLRPIIPLEYRLQMLAALEFVDYITWFDETDPRQLLSEIQPNVHVNGAEYGEDCLEAATVKQYGGRIHVVQLVPSLSTSNIIGKIIETEGKEKACV